MTRPPVGDFEVATGDMIRFYQPGTGGTLDKEIEMTETGTSTDMPDITQTAWGDCVFATAQLNGGTLAYFDTASRSADDLWHILRSHCRS